MSSIALLHKWARVPREPRPADGLRTRLRPGVLGLAEPPPHADRPRPRDRHRGAREAPRHAPGRLDLVLEVIHLFIQETPERLTALRDGLTRGDFPLIARVAHTIRGSAGHIGAKALTVLCPRVEDKARQGTPFNSAFALSSIEEELERVREALVAEAERLRGGGST